MAGLHDGRLLPQIPTRAIWLSVFGMYVLRLRSFNALEQELRLSRRWEGWVGARKPGADTIGRVFASMSVEETRQILSTVLQGAWRSKAIHPRPGESYRVVAVDGHEIGASRARRCPQCLVREIKLGTGTVIEYCHRFVVAQWVGVTPPAILDPAFGRVSLLGYGIQYYEAEAEAVPSPRSRLRKLSTIDPC